MADLALFLGKIDGLRLFFQFVALIFEAHFLFFALLRFESKLRIGRGISEIAKSLAFLGTYSTGTER
jgi:hypothetical protein